MPRGIRDRVVIIGMGCVRFGERWDRSGEDLLVEAFQEALADASITRDMIDAAWLAVGMDAVNLGPSGIPGAIALNLDTVPVTKVENYCASGTDAFRGAVYAVASGASDFALAAGVEKLKDTGYGGLPVRTRGTQYDMFGVTGSAPGNFAQLAHAYASRHGIPLGELKQALAHVSVKSHANAVTNPKAHLKRAISMEDALTAPMIADPLGLFDCCGVSDGAACAIVTTPERARELGHGRLVSVKALQLATSNGWELSRSQWDGSYVNTTRVAAKRAYSEAGIENPAEEISLAEVHDCFSITELVTMEDLGFSREGQAVRDVLDGAYDADGSLPVQIDGGLKCFGHPIGASGLRMLYEMYLQLLGRAGERQVGSVRYGLTHNLGGMPNQSVAAVSVVGVLGD
jgi:acetyl-CoA C-acetyltransferase